MCHDGKGISLKVTKYSYDRRNEVEFGLNANGKWGFRGWGLTWFNV